MGEQGVRCLPGKRQRRTYQYIKITGCRSHGDAAGKLKTHAPCRSPAEAAGLEVRCDLHKRLDGPNLSQALALRPGTYRDQVFWGNARAASDDGKGGRTPFAAVLAPNAYREVFTHGASATDNDQRCPS
jgi:hypothetical protein